MHFLDTNILLYSISDDPGEQSKRSRAVELLDLEAGALSVQVLQEFYVQATRPTRKTALTHRQAVGLIQAWKRFRIQDNTLALLHSALRIRESYRFSYWDSAVLAAAKSCGCDRVYTEDLSHVQVVDGLEVIDPFR